LHYICQLLTRLSLARFHDSDSAKPPVEISELLHKFRSQIFQDMKFSFDDFAKEELRNKDD